MEFWGVEVKAGESLKVQPKFGKLLHISLAAIGEVKDVEGAKHVPIRMTIDANKYVMGTLSAEDRPQLMFDLVFEKEFELSHDWKSGSVYFIGYIAEFVDSGKPQLKVENVKPTKDKATAAKTGIQKEEASDDDDDDVIQTTNTSPGKDPLIMEEGPMTQLRADDDDVIQTTNTSPGKDPLIVEEGPMTRSRAKKVKEAMDELVQATMDKITSKRPHA